MPWPGDVAWAPDEPELVTVERRWRWPFPYAECRTRDGRLITVPVGRLTF